MKPHLYQLILLVPDASLILLLSKWLDHTYKQRSKHIAYGLSGVELLSEKTQVKDQNLILYFRTSYPLEYEGKEIFQLIRVLFDQEKNTSPFFSEWRKRTRGTGECFYIQNYRPSRLNHLFFVWLDKLVTHLKRKR